METGKMYALSILETIIDCNKTEAELGNKRAEEQMNEAQIAYDWVKKK